MVFAFGLACFLFNLTVAVVIVKTRFLKHAPFAALYINMIVGELVNLFNATFFIAPVIFL